MTTQRRRASSRNWSVRHVVTEDAVEGAECIFHSDLFPFFIGAAIIGDAYFIYADLGDAGYFSGYLRLKAEAFFLERYRAAYALEIAHFFDAVQEGKPVRTTVADGLKALELAEAATRSWREGTIIKLGAA